MADERPIRVRRGRSGGVVLVAVVAATVLFGCTEDGASPQRRRTVGVCASYPGADSMLPTGSLEDWVTYGVAFVAFTVRREAEPSATTAPADPDEPVDPEELTLVVDEVLWSDGSSVPDEVPIDATGIALEDRYGRFPDDDRLRLADGGTYVTPLADYGVLYPMGLDQVVPLVDGRVDLAGDESCQPHLLALDGLTLEELRRTLADTPPDPAAAPFRDLPGVERYQAVVADD